jgi:hypothetical protein
MRELGIWLDLEEAVIIDFKADKLDRFNSGVEHFHPKGGSRSKVSYGPQDVISESKLLERKKHQLRSYFQTIVSKMGNFDRFVVFGPAEAKIEFKQYAEDDNDLRDKLSSVETTDNRFTDNQLKEWVRNYFEE